MSSTRLVVMLIAVAVTVLPGTAPADAAPGCRPAGPAPAHGAAACTGPHRPGPVGASTAGRVTVDGRLARYSWPGVYFEGRFRGTGVGIVLDDAVNDYAVEVDGVTVATLVTPGRTTYRVTGLTAGRHTVRLVKRTESPTAAGAFGDFVAVDGGRVLAPPPARHRQIEFIGDSLTAGYGNLSTDRECTDAEATRRTDADLSFGALTARRLDADYQLNAYSGLGMVRNHDGGRPDVTYRTFYPRSLLAVDGDVWDRPASWRPQLVVVGLGANDFATDLRPDEAWTPQSLRRAYRDAYHRFLDRLRVRYGRDTLVVVTAQQLWNTTAFAEAAAQVVRERHDLVRYWYLDGVGLDYGGCRWHPSRKDHEVIAERLGAFLATVPLRW
ncbi:SGNH/GDSL hydrolase family protein [Micromonospora sp. S-DT3-3-22]|uniref:SGNH/GDSL hydrolase family protein n=1 Tax=Micromonospora sp. S-DT3-3-22 TaxID=2755359 RepID=UPI0028159E79|nr:SGNH/GDSL hydrolase family protein [Micromonospora sp. S-DT3-3-22]